MGICWSFDCNSCQNDPEEFPPPRCVVKTERWMRQMMEPVNKMDLKEVETHHTCKHG
jgi:hypothetical protein